MVVLHGSAHKHQNVNVFFIPDDHSPWSTVGVEGHLAKDCVNKLDLCALQSPPNLSKSRKQMFLYTASLIAMFIFIIDQFQLIFWCTKFQIIVKNHPLSIPEVQDTFRCFDLLETQRFSLQSYKTEHPHRKTVNSISR